MKTISLSLLLTACLLIATGAEAQKRGNAQPKLYRWVDENGEVHFSESVPPGFQDENNQLQKKAGGGWQKDGALAPPPPPKLPALELPPLPTFDDLAGPLENSLEDEHDQARPSER